MAQNRADKEDRLRGSIKFHESQAKKYRDKLEGCDTKEEWVRHQWGKITGGKSGFQEREKKRKDEYDRQTKKLREELEVVTTQRRPITQEVEEADRRERARQRQELGTLEIWTDRELRRDWSKTSSFLFLILLLAEIGFSVGKLFPGPSYLCDSWSCRKVTHECLLTLCPFPLQLLEFSFLFLMMKEQRSKVPVLFKIADYSAALAYVVYGAATQKPPGVGTIVLVVITCMAEVLLIAIEAHIFGLNFGQFRMVKSISNCYRQPDLELSPVAADSPPTEPVASAQMRRGIETLPFASSADLVCSSGPNPTVVPLQPAPVFASQNDFSDFKSSFGGFGGGSSGGDQPSFGGFGGGGFGGGFGGGSSGGDQPSFGGFGGGGFGGDQQSFRGFGGGNFGDQTHTF